ncbi:mycothiol transferase [Antrihabitans cavernicola]|uniref:DinB family protein n=1 Tax=Antrihabitans cavernicola TaxID=2495913 RepID=A0A5A7SE19_9NOCA|nr:DinB family protein [Spelaeibacter cavernicola]KAA0024106.1 DinB family protein [Spelaeibacter cavernicola]
MDQGAVLADAFDRIQQTVHAALADVPDDALTYRIDGDANTIAWLVWHLTRVQDDHVAGVAGTEQVWTADGWNDRFDLPFPTGTIGYGQTSDDVAAVQVGADLLLGYHDAVHDRTVEYVRTLGADDLDRVVDDNWDPPVTLGVRLVSVVSDDLQHIGQAAYIRGVYERR